MYKYIWKSLEEEEEEEEVLVIVVISSKLEIEVVI